MDGSFLSTHRLHVVGGNSRPLRVSGATHLFDVKKVFSLKGDSHAGHGDVIVLRGDVADVSADGKCDWFSLGMRATQVGNQAECKKTAANWPQDSRSALRSAFGVRFGGYLLTPSNRKHTIKWLYQTATAYLPPTALSSDVQIHWQDGCRP